MVPHSSMFRAAASLTAAGMALVLANWHAKPDSALAWTAALVIFAVMAAALRMWRRAVRDSGKSTAIRGLDSIPTAVVFAALMMGIPLALTLADSYGLFDGADLARRSTGVLIGIYLAMVGNFMPKNLPPLSSMGGDAARHQTFQRRAGWTWALCGLSSAIGWLALPVDTAGTAEIVLMLTAMGFTVVHLLRLRRPRKDEPVPGLN